MTHKVKERPNKVIFSNKNIMIIIIIIKLINSKLEIKQNNSYQILFSKITKRLTILT